MLDNNRTFRFIYFLIKYLKVIICSTEFLSQGIMDLDPVRFGYKLLIAILKIRFKLRQKRCFKIYIRAEYAEGSSAIHRP